MNESTSTGRLVQAIKEELAGRRAGERLPSTRQLVETYRVSPVTVSQALASLATEGLIETRPGAGSFVAAPVWALSAPDFSWQTVALGDRTIDVGAMTPMFDPVDEDGVISLASGYLHPSLIPVKALGSSFARATRLPDVWGRPPVAGLRPLRAWFAQSAGPGIDPADVLVSAGGQGSLSAALRALVPAGEALLVESPTYPGVLAISRLAGIRPIPVPVDNDGVVPDLLAEAFARSGARAFYCQPRFQNPTGADLAADRRAQVLAIAADARAFVIEDDYAHWLAHGEQSARSLLTDDTDGRVVYITSLSKAVSPSLRVGAIISRGPVSSRLQAIRVVDDLFVARPVQEATLDFVSRPYWARHLRSLTASLNRRAHCLSAAIARHLPALQPARLPRGGMHLWVRLPAGVGDRALSQRARRMGVVVSAGSPFFAGEAPSSFLRLTFSSSSEAELEVGVRRLARALDKGDVDAGSERLLA